METGGPLEICRAAPSDAKTLTTIAIAAKGHWGYPAHWMERWRSVLTVTPAFIAAQETFIARVDDRILGFAALRREGDTMHIEDLFVLPGEMGRGIGSALFRRVLCRARELGFAAVEIQSDPNAAGFYERMGADRIGTNFILLDSHRRDLPIFRCRTTLPDD